MSTTNDQEKKWEGKPCFSTKLNLFLGGFFGGLAAGCFFAVMWGHKHQLLFLTLCTTMCVVLLNDTDKGRYESAWHYLKRRFGKTE